MEHDKTTQNWHGLSSHEVSMKLENEGYNEISEKEESSFLRLLKRFWGPIPWMIEVAAVLSAVVKRWEDFTIIIILLLVNAFVDFYQESKALSAIAALKKRLAREALVLRDGKWIRIPARELVVDDIVKVKIGDIVPADVKLMDDTVYLSVDQSALTGESLPVDKNGGDMLYANAIVKQGESIAIVTAIGEKTYFGKTVGLVAQAQKESRSHFQKMVMTVGNFLIAVTVAMIAVIVYFGISRDESTVELLVFALVLTISAIPVAMPAVLTVTMAVGAMALAKKSAIVSRLSAIEELAGMGILCSDKTGTLTQNRMTLSEPYLAEGYRPEELLLYAALASREENNDPIEKPVFEAIDSNGLRKKLEAYTLKQFIPFDPVRKRTEATMEHEGCEMTFMKGAPQVVIDLSQIQQEEKKKVFSQIDIFAQNGFRTLGVAFKSCKEEKFVFVGLIPLFDPPREDSLQAINSAESNGIDIKMITGDNVAVARYIAKILNIGEKIEDVRILKGESVEEYVLLTDLIAKALLKNLYPQKNEDEILKQVDAIISEVKKELYNIPVPKGSVKKHESQIIALIEEADGFAQVYPEDKYFIVDSLQKGGHIVGMTGDGVNDAPALKKADCGIAVSGATDAARAAADIVLIAPGLSVIVDAVKVARITFERMKSYTIFRIAETIRIILFMTLSIVIFQFYPLTALMIIVLALLNDIPILTIAYDNTKVRSKPVRWDMYEVLVLSSWLGIAGVVSSFILFWFSMRVLHLPEPFIQSLFFVKLVVAGHGTIYNTRIDDWFFKRPWPSKTLFLTTFSSRVIGTVIGVYGFGLMEPIGWKAAFFAWVYALSWFLFNDAIKMVVLKYYRKKRGNGVLE